MESIKKIISILFSKGFNFLRLWGSFRHKLRIRQAHKVFLKLKQISNENTNYEPIIIAYLRKIHPSVFEELVLTTFEKSGVVVIRNKYYSGDGGIDGRIHYKHYGVLPVQCKRYGKHINKQDVIEFNSKLTNNKFGLFAHTGKTGGGSKDEINQSNKLILMSGFVLARLLAGQTCPKQFLEQNIYYKSVNKKKQNN